MTQANRVPAFLLLGLVVVAAIVLLAGYGVIVAIGLLVGLVLGIVVILAFVALGARSGGGASFSWLTPTGRSQPQPDHVLIEQHSRDAMRVMGVDESELQRVIAVGASADAGGAHLELIALELRTDGGIATLVAHTSPPAGFVGHFADVVVSDDAGTAYVASGQGSGGPSPRASRHEIRFSPTPPVTAKVITIQVVSFADPFPGRAAGLTGPWEFRVEL